MHVLLRSRVEQKKKKKICRANQWTGFYLRTASVMKELTSMHES